MKFETLEIKLYQKKRGIWGIRVCRVVRLKEASLLGQI